MVDGRLYLEDAALDRLDGTIVEAGELEGRPWVRLAATIFYPEGGGQPSDRGTIRGVRLVDVQTRARDVLHFVERPLSLGPASCRLDVARRFDHRQQHTAQHLLTAILQDRYGLPTTAFHLGEDYTAVDVDGPTPSADRLARIESDVNEAIRGDAAVRVRWVGRDALDALDVRTRGLPDALTGPVRLVEIEGFDLNTCGGTHVDRLAEIQIVHILDAAPARGGTRVRFLAGQRVLARLARHEATEQALKRLIGTAPEEFPDVIEKWSAQRQRLERRLRGLEGALAEARASELAATPGDRIVRVFRGAGPDDIRALASSVLARRPSAVVVLAGESGDPPEACFLVQAGPDGPDDVGSTGAWVRDAIGARGGGRGKIFQGRGGRLPIDATALLAPERPR